MNLVKKILIIIFGFGSLAFAIYQTILFHRLEASISDFQIESRNNYLNFDASLGRARIRIDESGALLDSLSKSLPKDIRADLNAQKSELAELMTAKFELNKTGGGEVRARVVSVSPVIVSSDHVVEPVSVSKCNEDDKVYQWSFNDWRFDGTLTSKCRDGEKGNFTYNLHQKFDLLGVTTSEGSRYVKLYELDEHGERGKEPLKVVSFDVVRKAPDENRFYWWDPHLNLGVGGQVSLKTFEPFPSVEADVSLMGYGKTENDLLFQFLRVGVSGSSEGPSLMGCPASYNVGDPLPLLSNLWIGPCYFQRVNGSSVGLDIGAQL